MEIYSYKNLKKNVVNKSKWGCDKPEHWNKVADELFEKFGIKRTVRLIKVVYGGSDYPCDELYFENGMNLHLNYMEEKNEETLRNYGIIK